MTTFKRIILYFSIIGIVMVLFPQRLLASDKDSTALKRKLIISVGYGDAAVVYIDNWINNGYKSNSSQQIAPQVNPLYAKLEYRVFRHMGIGVDVSYDDYESRLAVPSSTNYAVAYKGYTFVADVRINRHIHLIHKRLDLYCGVGLGYQIQSISNLISTESFPKPGTTNLAYEITFGGRFYITKRIGIYAEGGLARSIIQGGLAIRL